MSKVAVGVVLYLYLVSISDCSHHDYTDQVIIGLQRALQYMTQNAKKMNLDALFGLVLTEGK